MFPRPSVRPSDPCFGSGPCRKRPGWTTGVLDNALCGRSHRAKAGLDRIRLLLEKSRAVLNMPEDFSLGLVPGSDTGAVEMALWSLLGARGVDVMVFDVFGERWAEDIETVLPLADRRIYRADAGSLPDFGCYDPLRDCVFVWNGTTSGVAVPDADWIAEKREGLVICDATSGLFSMPVDWRKLDVVTWSWQKTLGGEAAHGMLALSPRARKRLEHFRPPWPVPRLFRLAEGEPRRILSGIFEGKTINTPSMLCVEDALDGLDWALSIGGLAALIRRSQANLACLNHWVEQRDWIDFLASDPRFRSSTSMVLKLRVPDEKNEACVSGMCERLARETVAYDIRNHRGAPPSLRIWGGATVETREIETLLPWLDWAYHQECGSS